MCPNCHWEVGHPEKPIKKEYFCVDRGTKIDRNAERCVPCYISHRGTKIIYPSLEELIQMVKETSYVEVARQLNSSDNAIRKRLRTRGVDPKTFEPI